VPLEEKGLVGSGTHSV